MRVEPKLETSPGVFASGLIPYLDGQSIINLFNVILDIRNVMAEHVTYGTFSCLTIDNFHHPVFLKTKIVEVANCRNFNVFEWIQHRSMGYTELDDSVHGDGDELD